MRKMVPGHSWITGKQVAQHMDARQHTKEFVYGSSAPAILTR